MIGTYNPLLNTGNKIKLIRHFVNEFSALVIDLDCKETMSAHHFLQKLGNSRSNFAQYWLCPRPLTEIVNANDKVAMS